MGVCDKELLLRSRCFDSAQETSVDILSNRNRWLDQVVFPQALEENSSETVSLSLSLNPVA